MAKKAAKKTKGDAPVDSDDDGKSASGKSLVIVESPAKARTINKYLGNKYIVRASKGHVRDLPAHQYGIDPGRNFEPTYEILPSHEKTVAELRKLSRDAAEVYLATDLDREGEAIAWHLATALDLPENKRRRVIFNEITKSAIQEAFKNPHEINMAKVDAQQARRILDRVVGYELSPLLWKKIAKGLSAGRVQSVAVRLIVNREDEIRAFEPQEYWVLDGAFCGDPSKAKSLQPQWKKFLETGGEAGGLPTQKEMLAWLGDHSGFEASLTELNGKPWKPEGTLTRTPKPGVTVDAPPAGANSAELAKLFKYDFVSAVDKTRPLVESLGYQINSTTNSSYDEYPHLGLHRVELVGELNTSRSPKFVIKNVETKRSRTRPSAPFTTASIQQAASNQLRFPTSKTMKVAQALYEGVDIKTGEGNVGLITYMRTDSTSLSRDSVEAARGYISKTFGGDYLPDKPQIYETSAKRAQEAHEAIRPTDVTRTPDSMRGHLSDEQHKLYTLIWNRFVACQMTAAEWDSTTILISAKATTGEAVFKASGRVLVFDGHYRVTGVPKSSEDQLLPPLEVGQEVGPLSLHPLQKFTAPPPRYTEASLVKTLEAEGIGRPSTYAAIIKTVQDRGYVDQEDRKFRPTSRGELVTRQLVEHFPKIMDIQFTSHIEQDLDKIEDCEMEWHDVLHEFYDPFKESLAKAHENMNVVRAAPSEYVCDLCSKPMVYRHGRNGRFLSCSGYPDCTNAKNVDHDGKVIEPVRGAAPCEVCGKPMIVRKSRTGFFLGCTGYPNCTNTAPSNERGELLRRVKPEDLKQPCPECGGEMTVRFARGKAFFGCSKYPECKATAPAPEDVFIEKPKPEDAGVRCDKCGRGMVIRKSRRGPFLSCIGFPRCRNAMPMEKLDHLKELEAKGEIPEAPKESAVGKNGKAGRGARTKTAGKAKRLTKEEVKALGAPPEGFAWTLTGRPVVETWPEKSLTCFECGGDMTLRQGRFGPFFSCAKCRAAANLRGEAKKRAEADSPQQEKAKPIETDVKCPDCGKKMLLRLGRTGRFLGCSGYPKCKKTMEAPPGLLREVAAEMAEA